MSGSRLRDLATQVHRERGEPPGYKGPCWGPTQDDIDEAQARLAGCRAHITGFCSCGHIEAAASRSAALADDAAFVNDGAWSAFDRNRPALSDLASLLLSALILAAGLTPLWLAAQVTP